jgi:hypothetical protein
LRNREPAKPFTNVIEMFAGSDLCLLYSISKKSKYYLNVVVINSKFIKTKSFGLNPEAIKRNNIKIVNIQ